MFICEGCQAAWVDGKWSQDKQGPCTCCLNYPYTPNHEFRGFGRFVNKARDYVADRFIAALKEGDEVALYTDIAEEDELGNFNNFGYEIATVTRVITEGQAFGSDGEPLDLPIYVVDGKLFNKYGELASFKYRDSRHSVCPIQIRKANDKLRNLIERNKLIKDIEFWGLTKLPTQMLRDILEEVRPGKRRAS